MGNARYFLALSTLLAVGCDDRLSSSATEPTQNLSRQTALTKSVKPGAPLVDPRDNKTYATVQVAGKLWMAENLRFDTLNGKSTWCQGGDTAKCRKYGRLYNWQIAVRADSGVIYQCEVNLPPRGICPVGWHVPSKDEWTGLFDSLKGSSVAGRTLKEDSMWAKGIGGKPGIGTDSVGMSVLPAGYRFTGEQGYAFYGHTNPDSSFFDLGARAFVWTRTNSSVGSCWSAWGMSLTKDRADAEMLSVPRSSGLSVRCVKD